MKEKENTPATLILRTEWCIKTLEEKKHDRRLLAELIFVAELTSAQTSNSSNSSFFNPSLISDASVNTVLRLLAFFSGTKITDWKKSRKQGLIVWLELDDREKAERFVSDLNDNFSREELMDVKLNTLKGGKGFVVYCSNIKIKELIEDYIPRLNETLGAFNELRETSSKASQF